MNIDGKLFEAIYEQSKRKVKLKIKQEIHIIEIQIQSNKYNGNTTLNLINIMM